MKKISIAIMSIVLMSAPALAGDVAAGKAKAVTCSACHGASGVSAVPTFPNLAGQKEQYIIKQLKDFKSGARKDATMNGMAAALSEEDMANIAAYYSSLK